MSSIVVSGVSYPSIKAAALALGLNYSTVHLRLKNGWSVKRAFQNGKAHSRTIKVQGRIFPSLSAAAKAYDLSEYLLSKRLRLGWTIDQAFGLVKKPIGKPVTVEGRVFLSLGHACNHYGLPYTTVRNRIAQKWTLAETFGLVPRKTKLMDTGGIVYCITNLFTDKRYIGLTRNSLKQRLNGHYHSASSTKLNRDLRELGLAVFKIEALCRCSTNAELASKERFYIKKFDTIRNGYNTQPGGSLGGHNRKTVKYKGLQYASIKDLARATGISYDIWKRRLATRVAS